MGYYGRLELKLLAQKMRRQGRSYLKIMHTLHIPKSTVSDWCKDIQLTKKQLQELYESKKSGALKGSIIAAEKKKKVRIAQTQALFLEGKKNVGLLNKRDRFIAGIAFYASEGTKTDKGCALANSDPRIIQFMINWFKEFCHTPLGKFRGALWLHEDLSEIAAKEFWSKITGIPISQFYKSYRVRSKDESKKIRKNIHTYGVFTFYVSDVKIARQMTGWIGAILRP